MMSSSSAWDRRSFLKTTAIAGAALATLPSVAAAAAETAGTAKLKLGFDNFSVRGLSLKASALLDYAASLKLDSLLISDLDSYESLEEAHLKELRAKAADLGIEMNAGTWSICPTSKAFKDKWGTAEQHLRLGLRVAKALGSPVIRCVLGTREDRKTPGGIEARIADTVEVLKSCRSQAIDSGIKIAVENHAGDMQAWELVGLIEEAGSEYVGATTDSGNATWTMEDPLMNLEILGPYTVCTGMRDSMIWEDAEGAKVQWTAMGEGLVDWKAYFDRYKTFCPDVAVNLEIISGFAYGIPYLKNDFWTAWPRAKAADFAKFLALAKRGKFIPPAKGDKDYQKAELERSIKYCKEVLGMGRK